jgi:hypothetical protein
MLTAGTQRPRSRGCTGATLSVNTMSLQPITTCLWSVLRPVAMQLWLGIGQDFRWVLLGFWFAGRV